MIKRILFGLLGALGLTIIVLVSLLLWPLPEPPMVGKSGDFLIDGVRVVDVAAGETSGPLRVRITDGVIRAVGRDVAADEASMVIDGEGLFLLPGLWDMHTHSLKNSPQWLHPLWIANGVTGVREMSGCMSEPDSFWACTDDRQRWNEEVAAGERLAPRYWLHSSHAINGGSEVPEGYPDFFRARTADEVAQLVAFNRQIGTDFLKVYTDLSPDAYQMIARKATDQGLAIAGHLPARVSLVDALEAGQVSIEHPRVFLFECAESAASFRQHERPFAHYDIDYRAGMVDERDNERCDALMAAFAESDTWWTPTLQVLRMSALAHDPEFRQDERLKYIPYPLRELAWKGDADSNAARQRDEQGRNVYALMYSLAQQDVVQAHQAGVKMMLGTDAGDTYVFPGYSVHDELAELVDAGISPAEALRMATIHAAEFVGVSQQYGTIEVGKAGDVLLLDANPLEDISNTNRIVGLVYDGRYIDRAGLDELLAFVESQGNGVRMSLQTVSGLLLSPLMRKQLAD